MTRRTILGGSLILANPYFLHSAESLGHNAPGFSEVQELHITRMRAFYAALKSGGTAPAKRWPAFTSSAELLLIEMTANGIMPQLDLWMKNNASAVLNGLSDGAVLRLQQYARLCLGEPLDASLIGQLQTPTFDPGTYTWMSDRGFASAAEELLARTEVQLLSSAIQTNIPLANIMTIAAGAWALGGTNSCIPCVVAGGLVSLTAALIRKAVR